MSTFLLAVGAFATGWMARDLWDIFKGANMGRALSLVLRPLNRVIDWFDHGNRLTGAVLVVGIATVGTAVYGYANDRNADAQNRELTECISMYVSEQNKAQEPRTAASVEASDARRNYDRGFDPELPGATKAELLAVYLTAYDHYVTVRQANPYPPFSLAYCRGDR